MKRLREGNGDLVVLSRQIEALKRAKTPPVADRPIEVTYYGEIQEASKNLHETLSNLSSCPAEHTVNISLESNVSEGPTTPTPGKIGFNITWSCSLPSDAVTASEGPIPLAVESFPAMEGGSAHDVNKEPYTSARKLLTVLRTPKRKLSSAGAAPTPRIAPSSNSSVSSARDPKDLFSTRNVCADIKKQQGLKRKRRIDSDYEPPCLGIGSPTYKHILFSNRKHTHLHTSISLAKALRDAKTLPGGLPRVDRLYLAKVLSMAVLQFHPSPWLPQYLQSSDIVFFGIQDLNRDRLRAPYFSGILLKPSKHSQPPLGGGLDPALAPNALLASVGIILVELAFGHHISELRMPEDSTSQASRPSAFLGSALDANFRTALRLSEAVNRVESLRYEMVVQRCLLCDFDMDLDQPELDNIDLQKAFYQDVICELDQCYQAAATCNKRPIAYSKKRRR